MKAILYRPPGGSENLYLDDVDSPVPKSGEVLVRNFAAGVNRADLLQTRGLYPPPPGASEILGLEFAGEVLTCAPDVEGFSTGDRVFGIVAGGSYAEQLCVDHAMALRIPDNFSYETAAAVPEVFITAAEALFTHGGLRSGERVLLHAGASGVGTAAIQLAKRVGAEVIVTAGTSEKVAACLELGAHHGIVYREQDFGDGVAEITNREGVDLVVDFIGADYWKRNIASLRVGGRLVLLGLLGGAKTSLDLAPILRKRLRVCGHTLRGRPLAEKIAIAGRFVTESLPGLADGSLKPVIDHVFVFDEVARAHERMEKNQNLGKIVLRF
jgi:putative PIG3 family NAD(P)H quinone oxidoreductase